MDAKRVLRMLQAGVFPIADCDWWIDIDNPPLQAACKELDEKYRSVIGLAATEAAEDEIDEGGD